MGVFVGTVVGNADGSGVDGINVSTSPKSILVVITPSELTNNGQMHRNMQIMHRCETIRLTIINKCEQYGPVEMNAFSSIFKKMPQLASFFF